MKTCTSFVQGISGEDLNPYDATKSQYPGASELIFFAANINLLTTATSEIKLLHCYYVLFIFTCQ